MLKIKATSGLLKDDLPFQELDGCSIEIRAFDADYLEIYTATPAILTELAAKFSAEIEYTGNPAPL